VAAVARDRLVDMPVQRVEPAAQREETWLVAEEAGWAETYDAEYVASARLASCPLVTLDERLRRGASRLADVRLPAQL
jgi:predicted nucleic acid-binding protein